MTSPDSRVPFDEALGEFRIFLERQGQSADCLWLRRERAIALLFVCGIRVPTIWIFRPAELMGLETPRAAYEAIRQSARNIRLCGVGRLGERTVAYVESGAGESRMLNFTLLVDPPRLRAVDSALHWWVLKCIARVSREIPWFRETDL
jgi:hypothetical protein